MKTVMSYLGAIGAAQREAMDADAAIAWPERFNHDEVSAIQHAMNLRLQDEAAFFAEYQNEPERDHGPAGCKELLHLYQVRGRKCGEEG